MSAPILRSNPRRNAVDGGFLRLNKTRSSKSCRSWNGSNKYRCFNHEKRLHLIIFSTNNKRNHQSKNDKKIKLFKNVHDWWVYKIVLYWKLFHFLLKTGSSTMCVIFKMFKTQRKLSKWMCLMCCQSVFIISLLVELDVHAFMKVSLDYVLNFHVLH